MQQLPPYKPYRPRRESVTAAPQPSTHRPHRRFFVIAVAISVGITGYLLLAIHSASSVSQATLHAAAKPRPIPSSLQKDIDAIIAANSSTQIGVAVQNISSGEQKTYGIDAPFEAASTAKLLTACAYYHLVETGQASLDEDLGAYNAGFQIKSMVNQSSNDSWNLLVSVIGEQALEQYATTNGIGYKVDGNTLSPASMASLLTKLYSGQLLNKDNTAQLLSYMQHTNDDELIPAAVGTNITVYHKYGLLNGELHDAAILTDGNKSYALAIYTKGADDSDDAQRTQTIHRLTQAVVSAVFAA